MDVCTEAGAEILETWHDSRYCQLTVVTQQSELEGHSEGDQGGSGQDGTHGAFMGEQARSRNFQEQGQGQ